MTLSCQHCRGLAAGDLLWAVDLCTDSLVKTEPVLRCEVERHEQDRTQTDFPRKYKYYLIPPPFVDCQYSGALREPQSCRGGGQANLCELKASPIWSSRAANLHSSPSHFHPYPPTPAQKKSLVWFCFYGMYYYRIF